MGKIRLDKYLADMGLGTRTEVKRDIKKGRISVNGEIVKSPEYKIDIQTDVVLADGKEIAYEELVYYMLNKPQGVVSATEDRRDKTVLDLISEKKRKDLFPVGRLDKDTEGLLLLLNTVGGDVESGLAIAEMIASIRKPTVSLVLGGSHSIGVPLAVSTDYSFIVPSGTMVIHPVRMSGTVIGAKPTYDYFKQMQDRIVHFISTHSKASEKRLEELMMNTGILTKDLGTILVGKEAVEEGLINEVGGISEAFSRLHQMIEKK